jgi:hypothetical protein
MLLGKKKLRTLSLPNLPIFNINSSSAKSRLAAEAIALGFEEALVYRTFSKRTSISPLPGTGIGSSKISILWGGNYSCYTH